HHPDSSRRSRAPRGGCGRRLGGPLTRRCPATPSRRGKGCAGRGAATCGGAGTGCGAHACPRSPSLGRRRREAAEEEVDETPQEKKLRLAKLYLEQLRQYGESRPAVGAGTPAGRPRALTPALMRYGRGRGSPAHIPLSLQVQPPDPASIRVLRGHQLPVTCLVISPDDRFIFSASKDGSLIKCKCFFGATPGWEVESGKRLCVVPGGKKGTEEKHMGHASHVLCMAISSDGKYLATGDRNKLIMIWDTVTCKRLHIFTGHRDAVSGLSFRKGTHQLYSASHDRCVKVWNVAENAYVETLFGHQDVVTGLDSLSRECCVTAGGRDGTVRLWKIPEESQLVFYGHQGSIDCIQLINEEHMVSGADDGSVALWGLTKKKPLALARQAHGMQDAQGLQQPYWISAVAALRNSDLLATGSHSASVKFWKCGEGFRKLEPLWDIPLVGFVNSLKFSAAGDFLVAGIGQEHRLGRWWRVKEAKNSICIIPLKGRAAAPSPEAPDSS
ncbi:U3IP2 protein, partial [Glaucidium brasilianum]|nr:U3IP2 protein [Glaucidium brasilianum]